MTPIKTAPMSNDMRQCTKDCYDAAMTCFETYAYFLKTDGERVDAALLMLIQDSAYMCRLSADSVFRGSPAYQLIAKAAYEVCTRCAQDCVRFAGNKDMQRCADACVKAASACQKMAKA